MIPYFQPIEIEKVTLMNFGNAFKARHHDPALDCWENEGGASSMVSRGTADRQNKTALISHHALFGLEAPFLLSKGQPANGTRSIAA